MNERRTDLELLHLFAQRGDQSAFTDIVRCHLDLVYATALRKVGDRGGAEEISQNVFGVLARKAWQFAPDDSLPAWLHKTALLESQSWLRGELRRRRREQTAAELGTTMRTPDEQPAFNALVPLLDDALLSLREKDRIALLLRYYESQSLRSVGAALGLGEDAAQKRVVCAVEKLAQFFQQRGFRTATVAATTVGLQNTATAAPSPMVTSVVRGALRSAPALTSSTLLLARLFALTKFQKVLTIAILLAVPVAWHRHQSPGSGVTPAVAEQQVTTPEPVQPARRFAFRRSPAQSHDSSSLSKPSTAGKTEHPQAIKGIAARLIGLVDLPGFKAAFLEVAYPVTHYSVELQSVQVVVRTNFLFLHEGESSTVSLWQTQMTFEILQVNGRNEVVTGREDGMKVQYAFAVRDSKRSNVRLQESRLQDVLVLYGALLDRTILCHPALKQSAVSLEFLARDKNAAAIALRTALNKRGIMTLSVGDKFEAVFPTDQARAAKSAIIACQSAAKTQSNQLTPSGMIQLRGLELPQALDLYGEIIGRSLVQKNRLAGSPIFLISQTRLSRAEVVFAFDVLFSWQGLKAVFVGEDAFRVVPIYSR